MPRTGTWQSSLGSSRSLSRLSTPGQANGALMQARGEAGREKENNHLIREQMTPEMRERCAKMQVQARHDDEAGRLRGREFLSLTATRADCQ